MTINRPYQREMVPFLF